jgi:WD repeat-containing protein 26
MTLDREAFPDQLDALAEELMVFLQCLEQIPGFNQIPDFTAEAVDDSIRSFCDDLRYWSSCLRSFKGKGFEFPSIPKISTDKLFPPESYREILSPVCSTAC